MDQNSTNGAGADKRNWRERLGIGAKEIPKLSDEFREPPQIDTPAAGTARPAPRAPQPVTRTAPMAPRAPARAAPGSPPPAARATPRGPDSAAQDALAEKLRAQRAAAEKLAEQRVQAARERAEAKNSTAAEPPKPAPSPRPAAPPPPSITRPAPGAPPAPAGRPKFTFAEDEGTRREPLVRPSLASPTPRPAIGGDRAQPPFLRPSSSAGTRPTPPYRPIDPATGYSAPPRLQPPAGGRSFGTEAPGYVPPRPPVRRPPPLDPYVRPADARGYAGEEFEDDPRAGPRLGRAAPPARGRARPLAPSAPAEEFEEEDVFEDEAPQPSPAPRQRASARDYQNAYRETEEGFGEEQRRSSGPALLLLALLAAALLVGGVIWYYNAKVRNVAGTGTTTSDSVPVVSSPEQPAKTAAEQPADNQLGDAPAVKKKQIYDRIVGEQEVNGGQVQSTEEVPVQPATAQPAAPADGTAVDPAGGTGQIPTPDAPAAGTQTLPVPGVDEPPPLPLPPPPGGDQQGSLDQDGVEKLAAASAQPEQGSTAPPAPSAVPQPSSSAAIPLPPPELTTDGAAIASADPSATLKSAGESGAPAAKVVSDPVVEEVAPPPAPAKKATKTATKKKAAPAASKELGTDPVVLVPPGEPASPSQGGEVVASAPSAEQSAASAPPKKKKTLLDIFRGSDDADSTPTQSTSTPETQVAAVQPQTKAKTAPAPDPAPEQKTASVNGYVIQLSSFRSEPEARSEYGRLSQLYPTVVGGLPQRISQTKIGGSTRYQLALGPLNSRSEASRVCSALFSAGESDCIVRGP